MATVHDHHPAAPSGDAAPPRDHATLGRELGIFTTDGLVGAGLPVWLPAGTAVRTALADFVTGLERRAGYEHVMTPHLGKRELYELSGHWDHFPEGMWPPMAVGDEQLVLRPVNCPHHVLVYRHALRSHAELPVRIAELGGMYRMERSGVLTGLSRVRAMTLNDGHAFCTRAQVRDEVAAVLDQVASCYDALGIEVAQVHLSTRGVDGHWAGDAAGWDWAEGLLRSVLDERGVPWVEAPGDGAFYGPKIDVEVRDARERTVTLSTVQVDQWMPARFDLSYVDADGARRRPVMVHRSLVSTAERLVAHLLERHDGALPFWLAPVQAVVLPVAQRHEAQAATIAAAMVDRGLRAHVDGSASSLGRRVRRAATGRVPVSLVVGDRELEQQQLAVRLRGDGDVGAHPWRAVVESLVSADAGRRHMPVLRARRPEPR